MERKCRKRKCQRSLPDGYKHKYCENCRNNHVKQLKNVFYSCLAFGSTVIAIATKGRSNTKK